MSRRILGSAVRNLNRWGRKGFGSALLRIAVVGGMLAGAALSVLATSKAGAATPPMVAVGDVPTIPAGATDIGFMPASTPLSLIVVLAPRDQAALTTFIDKIYDPSSPEYHHYSRRASSAPGSVPVPAPSHG